MGMKIGNWEWYGICGMLLGWWYIQQTEGQSENKKKIYEEIFVINGIDFWSFTKNLK